MKRRSPWTARAVFVLLSLTLLLGTRVPSWGAPLTAQDCLEAAARSNPPSPSCYGRRVLTTTIITTPQGHPVCRVEKVEYTCPKPPSHVSLSHQLEYFPLGDVYQSTDTPLQRPPDVVDIPIPPALSLFVPGLQHLADWVNFLSTYHPVETAYVGLAIMGGRLAFMRAPIVEEVVVDEAIVAGETAEAVGAASAMKYPEGIPPAEGARIAHSIRRSLNVNKGNVAIAEVDIEGQRQLLAAISGKKSPPGTVPTPTERLFQTQKSGAMPREFDTEVKILEQVAKDLLPTAKGRISLYTEKARADRAAV